MRDEKRVLSSKAENVCERSAQSHAVRVNEDAPRCSMPSSLVFASSGEVVCYGERALFYLGAKEWDSVALHFGNIIFECKKLIVVEVVCILEISSGQSDGIGLVGEVLLSKGIPTDSSSCVAKASLRYSYCCTRKFSLSTILPPLKDMNCAGVEVVIEWALGGRVL